VVASYTNVLEKEAAPKIKTAKSLEMLNDRASHSTVTGKKTSNLIPLSEGTELIWHRKGTRSGVLQNCGKFIDELGNHTLHSKFSAPSLLRRINSLKKFHFLKWPKSINSNS